MRTSMNKFWFSVLLMLSVTVFQACNNDSGNNNAELAEPCFARQLFAPPELYTVSASPVREQINLSGDVRYNKTEVSNVYAFVSGLVTSVNTSLGAAVNRGQILATVQSREIADLLAEKDELEIQLDIAKEQLEMTESMFDSELATRQDLQSARSAVRLAEAELTKVQRSLTMLGATGNGATRNIIAPRNGFVVEMNIARGSELPDDFDAPVFVIGSLDKVWVIGNVYESDIARIKEGQQVYITTMAYPDTSFKGEITRVSGMLDPVSKVMQVRIELDNPDYLLKPGMFARIRVESEQTISMPEIPSDAVLFDNNQHFVVVQRDECNFIPRIVRIHAHNNGRVYIQSGLDPGEIIIADNPLLVYSAL